MLRLAQFLGITADDSALSLLHDKHENRRFSKVEKAYVWLAGILRLNGFDWTRRGAPLLVRMLKSALGEDEIHLGEKWEKYLTDTYGDGNRKLMDEYGLSLEEFGYPIARSRDAARAA
jgi:hypothetical protein